MLGVVMADLVSEFVQAVAIAWACFGLGVVLFRMGCRDWHARLLSRGLLFLSPFVLTCFGVHATRENQQLAAIVAAKKGEAIDERIYLASIATADLGDGVEFRSEYYTDGSVVTRGQVRTSAGRVAGDYDGVEAKREDSPGEARGLSPLHDWTELGGHATAARRL
jgi:uncharacterized membrane protein YiaA